MTPLTRDKFLSPLEFAHLKAFVETNEPNRDQLLIQLAIRTGARASELLAIKRSDLDHDARAIYIKGLKGSRDRLMPLSAQLFEKISALPGERPFNISYSRLHQIWDLYSPNRKKFHSIRHTFAVELYKRTRDILLVQLALGHKDLRNTMVYVDFVYSQEELRKLLVG